MNKDGSVFFNCDQKIHHGLIQNRCFANPFRINDRARKAWYLRAGALPELVFRVLPEGHQGNMGLSAFRLLHKNHENGLDVLSSKVRTPNRSGFEFDVPVDLTDEF